MRLALAVLLLASSCHALADEAEPQQITYAEPGGKPLKLHLFMPDGASPPAGKARPALLAFHGGGWSEGEPAWTYGAAKRFAALGYVAASVQYRLSGKDVTPIDSLADVCASLHWLRQNAKRFNLDPKRIAAYGVSAGGHLSAASATLGCGNQEGSMGNGGPDALLLLSPAINVANSQWFAGLLQGKAKPESQSPLQTMQRMLPPVSMVQGDADTLTPAKDAQAFCERAKSFKGACEVNLYSGVGHLLTRNLKHQESDFDIDPAMRADGYQKQIDFLQARWGK